MKNVGFSDSQIDEIKSLNFIEMLLERISSDPFYIENSGYDLFLLSREGLSSTLPDEMLKNFSANCSITLTQQEGSGQKFKFIYT